MRRLDSTFHDSELPATTQLRLWVIRVVVFLAFAILLARVVRLQVIEGESYTEQANQLRYRELAVPAPRGVIYDRNNQLLVRNVPSFSVSIVPADLPDDPARERAMLQRLVDLLGIMDETWLVSPVPPYIGSALTAEQWEALALAKSLRNRSKMLPPIDYLQAKIDAVRDFAPYKSILIKTNIGREQAFVLEEEHLNLPGVHLNIDPLRLYTTGDLTAHLLGYVGQIPEETFPEYQELGYDHNDPVGLTGLEQSYEAELRGEKGIKHVEVDVVGREVRTVGEITEPVPGNNLTLTLDLELQRTVKDILQSGLDRVKSPSGVAIVMNPNTGEILAMVSLPAYDNNLFSGGISWSAFEKLNTNKSHPLVNHAIGGQYPPGSVFKIVPASAGLQEGVITEKTTITCNGAMYLPNQYFPDDLSLAQKFVCWIDAYGGGHGSINIIEAIAQSCDIYFYQLGGGFQDFRGLGQENLARYAELFGYGNLTKIDLPGETTGLIPTAKWKRLNYAESWVTGDTYNMSIGQGFVLATPLQVLNATATIANNGTLYQPHLILQVTDEQGQVVKQSQPVAVRQLPISQEAIHTVQTGLLHAIEGGTARRGGLSGVRVAGKTGTAEFAGPRDSKGKLPTHAWFTAYAPFEQPEIAVVVFVYGGGEGSEVAAPIAAQIMSAYFHTPAAYPLAVDPATGASTSPSLGD